jgi:uncharacterized YccA/Bax inhibitor family protein
LGTGYFGWQVVANNNEYAGLLVLGSLILGFGIALVTIFKKTHAPITAPLYALVEGFLLGAISQTFETEFNGIVLQAILLTVGIFLSMLLLYLFRIIKVTENLKLGIAAATGGIALFYLTSLVVGFFGGSIPLIASTSGWGIAFTVFVIVIAAFNLVMDFDFIELGVEKKAPKYMEWYASFGLLVTLVWLYLEILRLLAKLRSR